MTLSSLRKFRATRLLPFLSSRREHNAVVPYIDRLAIKIASSEQDVASLSGGTQQKVITARALMSESSLIIMDEPTAGIDVNSKEEIYTLIDELKRQGKAVLLIASDFSELALVSDRVVVLAPSGNQICVLDGAEVTESAITRKCFDSAA